MENETDQKSCDVCGGAMVGLRSVLKLPTDSRPEEVVNSVKNLVAHCDTFKKKCCQMEAEQEIAKLQSERKLSIGQARHEMTVIMGDLDHFQQRLRELRQRYRSAEPVPAEGTEGRRAEGDQGGSPKGTEDGGADVVEDEED